MTLLTIDWEPPAAPTGDRAALWVFGVVIDARSVRTRRFVRRARRPGDHRIQAPIEPIDGLAIAGVIAVLCDWSGCGGAGEASAHEATAGAALDRLVDQRLPAASTSDLQLCVEQDLVDTVRRGWEGLGPLVDRHLAAAHWLATLDGRTELPFDLALDGHDGPYVVRGSLRQESVAPPAVHLRVASPSGADAIPVGGGR